MSEDPADDERASEADRSGDGLDVDREGDPFDHVPSGLDDGEGDPFGDVSSGADDREGDPFEALGEAGPGPREDVDPFDAFADETGGPPNGRRGSRIGDDTGSATGADVDNPASEGAGRPPSPDPERGTPGAADRDGGTRRGDDPFFAAESMFERMDVDDLDADAVWEHLADAESRGSVTETRERTYAEVSKHAYCESCEHFSDPVDIECSHEGTEILAFTDMETVRVVDCPVVADRRKLQEED